MSPQSTSWTTLPDPSTSRYSPALARGTDGRIYAFGGSTKASAGTSNLEAPVAVADVLDPASKT